MAFSRNLAAVAAPPGDELTARMVGIGMNFAAEPRVDADIESTLLHASELGMLEGDLPRPVTPHDLDGRAPRARERRPARAAREPACR